MAQVGLGLGLGLGLMTQVRVGMVSVGMVLVGIVRVGMVTCTQLMYMQSADCIKSYAVCMQSYLPSWNISRRSVSPSPIYLSPYK